MELSPPMPPSSENRGMDLEKELTCSICTDVLYQPLTLLDCLHTFCGSCLKEWFSWQLTAARANPNSLPANTTPYTCPSCRAPVRDTKHNATVTTLVDMIVSANPEKGKSAEEKEEVGRKYSPGENVLVRVEEREKTLRERRVEDDDRRLMEEVRGLSLREVGVETSEARRERRRREESGRRATTRSRDQSRDGRSTDERERERRRIRQAERRLADEGSGNGSLQVDSESTEERRRRRSTERRSRNEESTRTAVRQIEHQSSLRSLISMTDVDSREMEEEILRQIREEGLLDGIDLENIDVSEQDQISERIAEAFRRRQSERRRQEPARRSNASGVSAMSTGGVSATSGVSAMSQPRARRSRSSAPDSRETSGDDNARPAPRRPRAHSRTPSSVSQEPQSRPPQSMSALQAAHLEVQSGDEGRHRRRRTTSNSRSATTPTPVTEPQARPAARSSIDLSDRPQSAHFPANRPAVSVSGRSTTDPTVAHVAELPTPTPELRSRSRASSNSNPSPRLRSAARMEDVSTSRPERTTRGPPENIQVPTANTPALAAVGDASLIPAPLSPRVPHGGSLSDRAHALSSGSRPSSSSSMSTRNRSHFFSEPSITCNRCSKPHIEYTLHFNCSICHNGNWNICLECYRAGAGCLHWFGFGQAAWIKWDKLNQGPEPIERPHMLTGSRFLAPKIIPGGAEGRKTMTTDDPRKRLQSGTFCTNCSAWTNKCYWRCDVCHDGDWGFCNNCVNQGKCCTHALIPLTYEPEETNTPPLSPTYDQKTPNSATILTGPGVMDIGPFKPLTFSTKCDICHYPIQPSQSRYHCFSCVSKVPNTSPGDYDICTTCYPKLVASRRISNENGQLGWRRCLQGHRMVVVGFEEKRGGQRRITTQDLVGGRGLAERPCPHRDPSGAELQKWSWGDGVHIRGDDSYTKLVTMDVMKTAPTTSPDFVVETSFPPNGGVGMSAVALWPWWPAEGADDELMFPKGAEIRECKNVNDDWWHGTYMGRRGLFPAPYVKILGGHV